MVTSNQQPPPYNSHFFDFPKGGFSYSGTSMAQTSLGPWKFVRDMGTSSHWGLIITPGQEANGKNTCIEKPFLNFYTIIMCTILVNSLED